MANFCCNTVHFIGNATNKEKLPELFRCNGSKRNSYTGRTNAPICGSHRRLYIPNSFGRWCTVLPNKWSPNFEVIKQIADHYGLGFHIAYDELGNMVYGEALYENGKLVNLFLEDCDFEQYEYQEETEDYLFEGKVYESDYDILKILMECKKAALEHGFMAAW